MFRSMHSVKRITFGVEAYPVGVLIAAYCFLPLEKTAFIYGILIGGFSDTMAEIVGRKYRFGELNIFGQKNVKLKDALNRKYTLPFLFKGNKNVKTL